MPREKQSRYGKNHTCSNSVIKRHSGIVPQGIFQVQQTDCLNLQPKMLLQNNGQKDTTFCI